MKFSELKSSLTNGIMPIYLIEGEDVFLRESAIKLLKDGFLSEPDLNLNNLLGQEVKMDVESLFNAVNSYPFMSDKRFVVVNEYYPTSQELKGKKLKSIFNEVVDTTVLIIDNSQKSEPLKKIENVTVVDCSHLEESIIFKWVRVEASKSQVIVEQPAINKLIEYSNGDMTKISTELYKLISFVGDSNQITENDVELICAKDTDYQIYELTEQIALGNNDKAFILLSDMLSKNQDKQKLFISLYYHFRRLLHCSISALSDVELAKALSVKEFAIKKSRIQAKKFKVKRLKEICDKLALYDSEFKRGDINLDSALFNSVFNALI